MFLVYPVCMDGFTGTGLACIRSERIVFAGLDFSVTPGEALVLSGPNGSGKSSLLRLMAGIARPAAGRIDWQGAPIADDAESFYADMHYVGHRDAVKQALTVRENLAFHCALRVAAPDIEGALELTGLDALADLPARMYLPARPDVWHWRVLASPALSGCWTSQPLHSIRGRSKDCARRSPPIGKPAAWWSPQPTCRWGSRSAASIDVSAFSRYDETLWGDAVGEDPAAGDWA